MAKGAEGGQAKAVAGKEGRLKAAGGADRFPVTVLERLQPGSFVQLRNHPADLPPFQLIRCQGSRCWVRQQAWGSLVLWEVARRRLTPLP
jgi:hypothetical protein